VEGWEEAGQRRRILRRLGRVVREGRARAKRVAPSLVVRQLAFASWNVIIRRV
jgi:hypothetical protein